jgi:hypothetical protein
MCLAPSNPSGSSSMLARPSLAVQALASEHKQLRKAQAASSASGAAAPPRSRRSTAVQPSRWTWAAP